MPERSKPRFISSIPGVSATRNVIQKLLAEYMFAIGLAAAVALIVRVFMVEAYRIPTDLMAPTLLPGDHVFVNKLAYSKFFSDMRARPMRGDVVIFSFPNDSSKDYIKRVVAVEGDTVEIRDRRVFVNGINISMPVRKDIFEETLDGHHYEVLWPDASVATAPASHMMLVTVPSKSVFVMGDNRVKGQDSRNFGFLPREYLKGKTWLIWFSSGALDADQNRGVRWDRILTRVK